ncbi:hypothetical protein HMPREF0043_00189 [Actinobaculum sp. oral taxon 183 str. F0552]|nr:hypothetical protein HMPREF0043_00189 [Actinobaculum sp. oral taxon 183 str. F0552]
MMNDHEVWVDRIIPAYAGSTARVTEQRALIGDHPRIRGEHAGGACPFVGAYGSSPHTRGARHVLGRARVRLRIIPAYAGSTPRPGAGQSPAADHPRIRGEHDEDAKEQIRRAGSSPHTRGARFYYLPEIFTCRIIPAYAGSTTGDTMGRCSERDHPRIRGEHNAHRVVFSTGAGSSPHTRGALGPGARARGQARIIPAYAGSTSSDLCKI